MATDKDLQARIKLSLRLDPTLRQQIEAAADRSLRSMNAEIIWRLRASLQAADQARPRAAQEGFR